MDEFLLMGSWRAAPTQLQAARSMFECTVRVRSVWMNATSKRDWLNTIDIANQFRELEKRPFSPDDLRLNEVMRRIFADKPC